MKKSLLAIIALAVLAVPFVVNAEDTPCSVGASCFTYTKGDQVNFYTSDADKTGQTTIIIGDEGASSQYVKALALTEASAVTVVSGTDLEYYALDDGGENGYKPGERVLKTIANDYVGVRGWDEEPTAEPTNTHHMKNLTASMSLPGIQDLQELFGGAYDPETEIVTLDVDVWNKVMGDYAKPAEAQGYYVNGFFTGAYDIEKNKVWVVKFTYDSADMATNKITKITIEPIDLQTTNEAGQKVGAYQYAYLPVIYFNKTYDCKAKTTEVVETYACYNCNDDYSWKVTGTQDATCTLVENVTQKSDCAKPVPTGVEDYILEFAGVAAVCVVALVLVKKNELFKSI